MTRRNLGAGCGNVIRTRRVVTDIARWEEVGLVQMASLVRLDLLVEIEATAVAPEDSL